jgi:PadR family transcriptional regulator, regulatory protein PadR
MPLLKFHRERNEPGHSHDSYRDQRKTIITNMKQHTLGEFEELVLLMVAALHDEAYGVAILENMEEKLEKKVNISAVHVALKRIEDKGFVKSRFGGITDERGGRRKKFYIITALGKRMLDKQYELRTSIYRQIPKISFG